MADTGAALDVGDAVLRFLGDTTQLDAAFNRVATEAGEKLGAAGAAAGGLGTKLEAAGARGTVAATSLADAFKLLPPVIQQSDVALQDMAFALRNVAVASVAGEAVAVNMREAKGEVMLLNHELNLGLNRHLAGFIARLPGVGPLLESAFAATAVLFLVEALVKGIEKVQEWAHSAEKISEAWAKVDEVQHKALESLENDVIKSQIKLDELTGKNLEALRLKLQLIDNVSLDKLANQLDKIAQEADKAFQVMDRNWFQKLIPGFEGITEVSGEFEKIKKSVDNALSTRTPDAFAQALKLLDGPDGEIQKTKDKLDELRKQQEEFEKARSSALSGRAFGAAGAPEPVDPRTIQGWAELRNRVEGYKAAIEDAQKAEENERKTANLEEQQKRATAAKKAAEEEFKSYKDLFVAKQALNKDLDKEQQDSEKQHELRLKQELKAEEDAAKERLELLKQQEQAAISELDGEIKEQQRGTTEKEKLYKLQVDNRIISEQQYLGKLKQLYDQDQAGLMKMLEQKEKLVILEVQNEAAQRGKILTEAQAKETKQYQDVENQKALITQQTEAKLMQAMEGRAKATDQLSQAIFRLILAGRQKEALDLVDLITQRNVVQEEILLAKARGANTHALEQELKAINKKIQGDVKEAQAIHNVKGASDKMLSTHASWDTFFKDLTSGALTTGAALKEMAGLIEEAIGQSVAAAVSGSEGFGQAMEKMLKSALAALAGEAVVKVLKELAAAASDLATLGMEWHAGLHFKAAAEWAVVAGVAGAVGAAIPGGGGKGASSGTGASTASNAPAAAQQPERVPVQTVNVQHFASGGLITAPTLAMVGDSISGHGAREGIIPLDDTRATGAIADAIVARMHGFMTNGDTYNWYIDGMISDNDLNTLTRKISQNVSKGKTRLRASDSIRVTRRS